MITKGPASKDPTAIVMFIRGMRGIKGIRDVRGMRGIRV